MIIAIIGVLVVSVCSIVVTLQYKKKLSNFNSKIVTNLSGELNVERGKTVFTITYSSKQPKELVISYYLPTSDTEASWEIGSFIAWKTKVIADSVPSA